ncbi:MAG TPA: Stk1 family PASTA domain-containing Ser/Thr kinase [Actinomycetota bacterium]|nr:Stk1 family PASTA domain-containing Ser/Thr kinase [Actinomycetota bacterium]
MSPRSNNISVLSDRYELREQLGAGGMAEVFLGKDRVLGRTVAIKTLLAQYGGDPHFIERFRREAQHAAALNHPNVVSVYDTGSDDGTHYIVMEYVEGKTLRDIIREEGPLLPERVAEIGADVCAGLAFAHSHGIVHRDIKPANIMITTGGAVKVTDFGIARAVSGDTVTQTAMVLGTAQYFSPEQAQSQPVDARSDIYSLGVVLYEMLTRQVPFTGSSPVAIAYKHVKEAPVLPSRLNPDVPPALEAIVMKAMAKNPDNRYQSAQEMREDLLRALAGRPVQATPVLSDQTGMISPLSEDTVVLERGRSTVVRQEYAPERRKRRTGWILLTLIVLAILGVAAWAILGLTTGPKFTNVPDVAHLTTNQAFNRLQAAGLNPIVDDPVANNAPAGTVLGTNPPAGKRVKKGSPVHIISSSGPNFVQVPIVAGKSEADARAAIEAAHLTVGKVTRQSDQNVRAGFVISQSPNGGFLQAGKPVDLVISTGKPLVGVPNVVGLSQTDAETAITQAGLNPQVVQDPTCLDASGNVCRQDPAAGQQVPQGSTVTIFVPVTGGPSPSETPTGSGSPSPSATPSF